MAQDCNPSQQDRIKRDLPKRTADIIEQTKTELSALEEDLRRVPK